MQRILRSFAALRRLRMTGARVAAFTSSCSTGDNGKELEAYVAKLAGAK
jgi:hypothetical protein